MKRKLVDKKVKKHSDGKCFFCPESDYDVLHCHRIVFGEDGGEYTNFNTLTVCANHHEKIHSNKITIHGKHFSTVGYVIHYTDEDGCEKWKSIH
jgi:hypothetical protein